jgi:hypothetical protein
VLDQEWCVLVEERQISSFIVDLQEVRLPTLLQLGTGRYGRQRQPGAARHQYAGSVAATLLLPGHLPMPSGNGPPSSQRSSQGAGAGGALKNGSCPVWRRAPHRSHSSRRQAWVW